MELTIFILIYLVLITQPEPKKPKARRYSCLIWHGSVYDRVYFGDPPDMDFVACNAGAEG